MKSVILTGATGYIARHCISGLLDKGYEVYALARRPQAYPSPHYHACSVDLLDIPSMQKTVDNIQASYLLHFAWEVEHGAFWEADSNWQWVEASQQLWKTFLDAGGKRGVFAGTCAEYAWDEAVLSEKNTPLNPQTTYGKAKLSLWEQVQSASASAAWGRIFWSFGPGEDKRRLVPMLVADVLNKRPLALKNPHIARDFLCVKDLADAFVCLLDASYDGAINLASGKALTLHQLAKAIALQAKEPGLLAEVAAQATEADSLIAETEILNNTLGWQPKTKLALAIDETLTWWKTQGIV